MNAADLASRATLEIVESWSADVRLEWEVLVAILQHDLASSRPSQPLDSEDDLNCNHKMHKFESESGMKVVYCSNEQLGLIRAAIQAELLTYRRINEGDP